MKKLVLVTFSVLIMAVFIGFNYLLWDRENREEDIKTLQSTNAYNNATINTLIRELNTAENAKTELSSRIEELEELQENSARQIEALRKENEELKALLEEKDKYIAIIKSAVNPEVFTGPVIKWVEAIGAGDYKTAYDIQFSSLYKGDYKSFTEFTGLYQGKIASMELVSAELILKDLPESRKNEFVVAAEINVVIAEGADLGELKLQNGTNIRYFSIAYDRFKEEWVIENITQSL